MKILSASQLSYTDCSTTSGILSLDPYVLRFRNGTAGEIYGNSGEQQGLFLEQPIRSKPPVERYNYDATQAFNFST